MVGISEVRVTAEDLEVLKDEIIALSKNLEEIHEVISRGMKLLSEDWKDEKYVEFEVEFRPRLEEISEISKRYHEWATKILPPKIEMIRKAGQVQMGIR